VDVRQILACLEKRRVPRQLASRADFKAAARVLLAAGSGPRSMVDLFERGGEWMKALATISRGLAQTLNPQSAPKGLLASLKVVRLRPPILRPGKIICVGRNYAEHARERGGEIPTQPIFFLKSNNTLCGPGDAIVIPPVTSQVDYEAEMAVVIGKGGKNIPEGKAYDHVAGYMCMNDVSARDLQNADKQWFRGKSCDTFAPIGPWIVTKDEIPDPHKLRISLTLNGQTMQDSNTANMIFSIPFLVSYLSRTLTWEAGDILSTGTPEGVGAGRTPPVFMKPGDSVSVTVEKIGTLTNPVLPA
jgi:2-keto-4-pentenoate hydratase/2-oxohepta-3-ene-1,7-dioic acid hydratase in catechol pathway